MATYITLIRFTERGAKNIKKSAARAREFCKSAEKQGVKVQAQYWTTGGCDGVLILSANDGNKVLRCLAGLTATGNVKTETMSAFDATEFTAITSA